MRYDQPGYTCKYKAVDVHLANLPESRYEKYAYRDTYRPPDNLAPPVLGNLQFHNFYKAIKKIHLINVQIING